MKTGALVFAGALLAIAVYVFLLLFTFPFARVTVKVLDEAGNPVPNATVSFSFEKGSVRAFEQNWFDKPLMLRSISFRAPLTPHPI